MKFVSARDRIARLRRMLSEAGVLATARHICRAIAARLKNLFSPSPPHAAQWKLISQGRYSTAISALERKLLSNPDDLQLYIALGAAHHARGCMPDAVAAWTKGMEAQAELARRAGIPPEPRYIGSMFTQAIGDTAHIDFIAKRNLLGLAPVQKYIVLAHPKRTANAAYLECWRDHFEIITDLKAIRQHAPVAKLAEDYTTVLFLDGEWRWMHDMGREVQTRWHAAGKGPLLTLTDERRNRAQLALESLGLPRDAWFVTLHVREGLGIRRNASTADYLPALRRITEAGGWVIRLGNPSMTKLPDMPNVIDYAHGPRKDWLDVYLIAAPRFFIGTNSGPVWAAGTFGVPALLTNWTPIGIQSAYPNITLPQRLWSMAEKRHLTPAEEMAGPLSYAETHHVFESQHVAPIPNTPEEIIAGVDEMLWRFKPSN